MFIYVCNMGRERPRRAMRGGGGMMYTEIGEHADVQRRCMEAEMTANLESWQRKRAGLREQWLGLTS